MFLTPIQQQSVISKLHALALLPESGVIAGQGIASIIYDELNIGVQAPINDIDIFDISSVRIFRALEHTQSRQASLVFKGTVDNVEVSYDQYAHITYINSRTQRGYRVIKSFTDKEQPIINKTLVSFTDQSFKLIDQVFDHDTLLQSFDFNACQVAYDLKANTFHYTKEFETFLITKQLKLASLHTPLHSAVRLMKKRNELIGAKCDVEKEMNMVTTYLSIKTDNDTQAIPPMGKRYFKLYEKYKTEIAPFFSLELNDQFAHLEHSNLYSHTDDSINVEKITKGFVNDLTSGVNFPAYFGLVAGDNNTFAEGSLTYEMNKKCLELKGTGHGYDSKEAYGYAFFLIKILGNSNTVIDGYSLNGHADYEQRNVTSYTQALNPYIRYLNESIGLGSKLAPLDFSDSIAIIDVIERLGNNGQWLKFLIKQDNIKPQSLAPFTDERALSVIKSFRSKASKPVFTNHHISNIFSTDLAIFTPIRSLHEYLLFCFNNNTGGYGIAMNEQAYICRSKITNNQYLMNVCEEEDELKKHCYYVTHYYQNYQVDKPIKEGLVDEINRRSRFKRSLWNLIVRPFVKRRLGKEYKINKSEGGFSGDIPF
jgi:hypothetical protein